MLRMVLEALKAREKRQGTSVVAIKVYIQHKYPTVGTTRFKYLLKQALETGMRRGLLTRPANSKAKGATGSFKVSSRKGEREALGQGLDITPLPSTCCSSPQPTSPQPSADPYCAVWGARTVSWSVCGSYHIVTDPHLLGGHYGAVSTNLTGCLWLLRCPFQEVPILGSSAGT